MQKKIDELNVVVQENLINIRVVKSFVREDFENLKFNRANESLREVAVKASGLVVMIMPVMQLVMNISIVAIVWFGGKKIIGGTFQVGQLMSFITYVTQILMSLMMLSMTIMTFSRAEASSERILDVLNTGIDIRDDASVSKNNFQVTVGKVEFKHVFFKYHPDSSEYVLKDINLLIEPGKTIALIGATGSAKTTLVELIPRLYDVTSGGILIDDRELHKYSLQTLRTCISLVLQQNELFSGTIKQNLKWGKMLASDEEIYDAAKDADAHDFIMSFPDQYDTILGQGGVNLSGGQKQRICIARAILRKPAVLILDDSTSAVDTATETRIRRSFRSHLSGTTIIIIAQRISSIIAADQIIILEGGQIIGNGTHSELIKSSQVYKEIYDSQKLNEELTL
jgi:ATP-binding cassette subfamily B protein